MVAAVEGPAAGPTVAGAMITELLSLPLPLVASVEMAAAARPAEEQQGGDRRGTSHSHERPHPRGRKRRARRHGV